MQVRQQVETADAGATCGEILRRQREERGISLREISHATKISVSHLTSLESNDLDALPGGAFTRGFLRAYATHVGLDAEEMVNHYLFAVAGRSEVPVVMDSPAAGFLQRYRLWILVAAGMVLVLAAVAWSMLGA